ATPCAVVENGTRPDQRVLPATLATLGETVAAAGIAGPALLIIGEVTAGVVAAAVPAARAAAL
ncbi:MAG: siroheme synthase CysG, partial [Caenispirillum sp.]|nr:siroheme synthase CysG [Caenispirillum sp.]